MDLWFLTLLLSYLLLSLALMHELCRGDHWDSLHHGFCILTGPPHSKHFFLLLCFLAQQDVSGFNLYFAAPALESAIFPGISGSS